MKRTVKSAIDSVQDALLKSQRDDFVHKTDDELRQSQLSLFDLAPWDNDMRAMPNDYARSALFTVRNKKRKREACDNKPIFHVNKDVTITYTGIELRAEDDELVWQQVLEYSKLSPLGEKVHFSIYQLCKDLGWSVNGRYYKKAEECLTRLQATSLAIASVRLGRLKSLSLIKEFEIVERGTKKAICEVELSPQMIYLFAGDHYTKFIWNKYRKLAPITRRLFDYMASHKEPFPLKLETFKLMCGSDTEQSWKWKQQAKVACAELVESELVCASWVQGDSIYCQRSVGKQTDGNNRIDT